MSLAGVVLDSDLRSVMWKKRVATRFQHCVLCCKIFSLLHCKQRDQIEVVTLSSQAPLGRFYRPAMTGRLAALCRGPTCPLAYRSRSGSSFLLSSSIPNRSSTILHVRAFSSSPTRPTTNDRQVPPPVVGTAPSLKRHLILHTPHASDTWPSHLETESSLYRALGERSQKLAGGGSGSTNCVLGQGWGFTLSDAAVMAKEQGIKDGGTRGIRRWDSRRSRFDPVSERVAEDQEV